MARVKPPAPHSTNDAPTPRPLGLDPVVAGTLCCVVSALGYSGANICMRQLAEKSDLLWSMWIVCNKELVTVAAAGPWLLWRAWRRLPILPSPRVVAMLAAVGLTAQLAGNLPFQWALAQVGLAVTVPSVFGVMLTATAVLGWMLLGERVTRRSALAIGLLLCSLVLLGMAAGAIGKSTSVSDPVVIALAVGAGCMAGGVYALLMIAVRHAGKTDTPVSTVVFTITSMGVLSMGLLSLKFLEIERMASTPLDQLAWMYAAGTLNLIAFLAITKGLQLTTVVHANVLNASQVAIAAVAGWFIFGERITAWLIGGVALTIVGVVMIDRPDRDVDQHA